jgi:hypothetical protein
VRDGVSMKHTMSTSIEQRRYEFDDAQNATFSSLATAMIFVSRAILLLSLEVAAAAIVLARSTLAATAILAPVDIAIVVIGWQLHQAAKHFRRIALTRGNDIQNLIVALNEMVVVHRVQRWLLICVVTIVAIALATTIVSR